jgi:hypothetical protein
MTSKDKSSERRKQKPRCKHAILVNTLKTINIVVLRARLQIQRTKVAAESHKKCPQKCRSFAQNHQPGANNPFCRNMKAHDIIVLKNETSHSKEPTCSRRHRCSARKYGSFVENQAPRCKEKKHVSHLS